MQTQAQDIVWKALPLMIGFGSWLMLVTQPKRTNPKAPERTVTEQIPTLLLGVAIGLLLFFASLFVASGLDAKRDAHDLTPNSNLAANFAFYLSCVDCISVGPACPAWRF